MVKIIRLFNKSKKGKVLIALLVIIMIVALILLLVTTSAVRNKSSKLFGQSQKAMINALNQKDSILSYLDTSALLAKKDVLQSTLSENAGFFYRKDVGSQDSDVTEFGTHIYPLISKDNKLCEFDYEQEYLKLFRYNLLKYTAQSTYLDDKRFDTISIIDGKINAVAELPKVELLISSEVIEQTYALADSSLNPVKQDTHARGVVGNIMNADINMPSLADLGPGDCSAFVNRLLNYAYSKSKDQIGHHNVECIPNNAWDVAACYLYKAKQNPDSSRVVYVGEGLKYEELVSTENLLEPGDLLFTTSTAWGLYTGYNSYESGASSITFYCKEDSIPDSDALFPKYCSYQDKPNEYSSDIEYENYPVITHIFMYLGKKNERDIIANLFNEKRIDQDLKTFVNNPYTGGDGVRVIIRPKYDSVKADLS